MKKIVALIMTLTLCLGMLALAGCKAKEVKQETRGTLGADGQTTAQDASAAGEGTEIPGDTTAGAAGDSSIPSVGEGEGDPLDAITKPVTGGEDSKDPPQNNGGGSDAPNQGETAAPSETTGPAIEVEDPENTESTEDADFVFNFEDLLN